MISNLEQDLFIEDVSDPLGEIKKPSIENLDEFVHKIRIYTGLPQESCEILLSSYIQEIARLILNGDSIWMNDFGKLFISSPATSKNKSKFFVKLKLHRTFLDKLK